MFKNIKVIDNRNIKIIDDIIDNRMFKIRQKVCVCV